MTDPVTPSPTDAVAKPWYLSVGVLGVLAALILTTAQKLGYLQDVTSDQLVQYLVIIIPLLIGLYGRLTASHQITLTAGKATEINTAAAAAAAPAPTTGGVS